jgi:hypothetical protein
VFLIVVLLVGLRLAIGGLLWEPVWSALTWDDFSRVLIARAWAADPVAVPDLVWLPLHTWLLGSAFRLVGGAFSNDPMALAAIVHTLALVGAAGLVGRTGYLISGSAGGGLLTFAALLFSPWGFYLSLSGLGETFYYLSVALAMYGVVRWTTRRSSVDLATAAVGIGLASALRYEGWWLAVAWAAVLVVGEWRSGGIRSIPFRVWLAAVGPFLVPAVWMAVNLAMAGSPVFFATESARYFLSAYGARDSVTDRLFYYPLSLLRAAPLLVPTLLVLFFVGRSNTIVRRLGLVIGVHLALFYLTSIVSSAVGAFNERFMFAFVVAALPILATLPALLARLEPARLRRTAAAGLVLVGSAVTVLRVADRPIEWTHSPDLLTLAEELAEAAPGDRPLRVVIDEELGKVELIPLRTAYGDRLQIEVADALAVENAADLPPGWDLYIDRFPAPDWQAAPAVMVGRYALEGPSATSVDPQPMPCSCSPWVVIDEAGEKLILPPGPYAWVEFTSDDPPPVANAGVNTTVTVTPGSSMGVIEVRSTYGHGFNPGRIRVEVRAGGTVVEAWDVAEPSRWRRVGFEIPPGSSTIDLEVAVIASPEIESDWSWGRASTVLVRSVEVMP